MELAGLILTIVAALTGVIAVLPLFGIKLPQIGRRQPVPLESADFRYSTPNAKAWIALGVVTLSLILSAFAAYYFFRPRIHEKIVEKPVDRIVEKVVQKDCSTPITVKTHKPNASPSGSANPGVSSLNQGSGSIAQVGGAGNQATVNNFGPPPVEFKYSTEEIASDHPGFHETRVTISTNTPYNNPFIGIVCDVPLEDNIRFNFGTKASVLLDMGTGLDGVDKRIAWIKFRGVAVEPDVPVYVLLLSKEPLHVLRVAKAVMNH